MKIYPLGGNPDSTVFVDAYDKPFDATIPYDATFFELLDRFVQTEPWLTRDKVMIDSLKTIGIEKGKPFKPGAKTRAILDQAAQQATPRCRKIRAAGGHLLRPVRAGGQGVQLGADGPEAAVRTAVPPLRPEEGTVRENVEAAGRRGSEVNAISSSLSSLVLDDLTIRGRKRGTKDEED